MQTLTAVYSVQAEERPSAAADPNAVRDGSDAAPTSPSGAFEAGDPREIEVSQRGTRVGGDLYCEDCGANKPTMGDPRTNSQPDARDGVRRWCVRCCEYLDRRPDAQPTHPFSDGWTYGLSKFKPYGADAAQKETAWPKNGWTFPNSAPVPRCSSRSRFVLQDASVASAMRVDPNASATSQLVQAIVSDELRPIQSTVSLNEKDDYIPEGNDRPPSPTAGDLVSTASRRRSEGKTRWGTPESYESAMSSSITCSGAP